MESLSGLKSVFPNWGEASTTAGNASGVGDGAALCILTTRANAEQEGMDIVAKWVGSAIVGVEPKYMGIAPIYAIPKLLSQVGLTKEEVDLYEVHPLDIASFMTLIGCQINEAFASQFAYCVEELGIPIEKINPKCVFNTMASTKLTHLFVAVVQLL